MDMAVPDKQAIIRELEEQHPEWRAAGPRVSPVSAVLRAMLAGEPREDYAHDPWGIMRVQPNRYKTAGTSLLRKGIESYSPTYKVLRRQPLAKIPPKRRHQAHLYVREVRRHRFGGYMFVRRMFGDYDMNRLFDLDGCGSLVMDAGSVARVWDYEVELMRLIEADGTMDEAAVQSHRGYRVDPFPDDKQWLGQSRIVGRLDDSQRTVLFVERMGRIARLITGAD